MGTTTGYGIPFRCPKCPPQHAFGMLKTPGIKLRLCPNCGSALVPIKKGVVAKS